MKHEGPCSEYRERITAWVDSELQDPSEVAALEAHIQGCEACRIYVEAEAATKSLVSDVYAVPVDVGSLRARTRERLDALAVSKPRRSPVWVPRLAWGALAAVLLVALTIGYLTLQPRATVEASPLVRAAVTDHVECMLGRLPLEVTTTDQGEVTRWVQRRLARPLVLPVLAPQGETKMSTRLARLATAEGAQILVDRSGRMLSLFIMPVREVSGRLGRRVAQAGREFFVNQLEGYTVVFWRQEDLLYCLVATGTEEEVLGFAAEYAGSPVGKGRSGAERDLLSDAQEDLRQDAS